MMKRESFLSSISVLYGERRKQQALMYVLLSRLVALHGISWPHHKRQRAMKIGVAIVNESISLAITSIYCSLTYFL